MARSLVPSIGPEATLDELAGLGKNRRFDEVIDDEENEAIQVICRRGGEEIPLAKPSRAFYFGDHTLYDQEAKRFDQEEKARILNTDQYERNLASFEDLRKSCQRGFVIPFVGAGMSVGTGLPSWTDYLLRLCRIAGLDPAAIEERLRTRGDYEGAINDIIERLGIERFERDFERDFALPETIVGPVRLLPRLFDRCAITTNFDRVLERVYEQEAAPFIEKVTGRGNSRAIYRAIPSGDRYLLKLHGNIDNPSERVLLQTEYEAAYGVGGDVHFESPLPMVLKRLFISYSFLFLGCSLATDRTILTFLRVAQELGGEQLPHHYAVLECPTDQGTQANIDQRLATAHITPIWYPAGRHESVEQVLELLLD
jgi:hypothetical protein